MDLPFVLYVILESIFMGYRTYQTEVGAGDWDSDNEYEGTTVPTKEARIWYSIYALIGWAVICVIYILAKFKWNWLYDIICGSLMLNLVVY